MARDFDADDLFFAGVADRNLTEARERLDQAVRQKRVADDDLIQKRAGESKAKAAQSRDVYENASGREQTAAGQAQRFGSMSAIDLAAGGNAILKLKTHGYETFSQEEKAALRNVARDRAIEEEKLGMKIAPTFEKLLPNGEFRPGGLAAARKAANEAGAAEENAAYAVKEVSTQGVADALQEGLDKLTSVINQKMNEAVLKIERAMFRVNNGKAN